MKVDSSLIAFPLLELRSIYVDGKNRGWPHYKFIYL